MNGNTRRVWWVAVAMLLVVGVMAATPLSGSAGPGSNSATAKLCQKGKWAGLQRQPEGTRFASEEECVSYGTKGGTIVPIPTPSISITFNFFAEIRFQRYCDPVITLSNFAPGTDYTMVQFAKWPDGDVAQIGGRSTTTDAFGTAVVLGFAQVVSTQIQIQIRVPNGVILYTSAWTTVDCS